MQFLGLFAFVSLLLSGCSTKNAADYLDKPATGTHFLTGDYVTLSIYDKGKEDLIEPAFDKIYAHVKKLEAHEQGISEIDEINNAAGQKAVSVSPEIFNLIQTSVDFSRETNGIFEPTIGAVSNLWHIGFPDARIPTDEEIETSLPLVNFNNVTLDEKNHTVKLNKEGMMLELGGVGKASVATQALNFLKENNVTSAFIDMGAHIFIIGDSPHSEDGLWTIQLENPRAYELDTTDDEKLSIGKVRTNANSLITTSIFSRFIEKDGNIYSHLLDSTTGRPINNGLLSVTIIGDDPIRADLLSNAVFNMGLEDGMKFINKEKGMEAIFATDSNEIHLSDGLKDKFTPNENSQFTTVE